MFRFKHFSLLNEGAAFKIGTDAVLLGSCASITGRPKIVLDAGTGTGIIALMIAQRLAATGNNEFIIKGIDINADAIREANINFDASPWAGKLEAIHKPLGDMQPQGTIDLIVSNPPYFQNSLENPDPKLRAARHAATDGLSWQALLDFSAKNLASDGRLAMILPQDAARKALEYDCLLKPSRILKIKTTPGKEAKRVILEFSFGQNGPVEEELTIQEKGQYTPEYLELTKEFHIFA